MNLEEIREALWWCTVMNYGILLAWAILFMGAGKWLYRIHGIWFPLSRETFNAVHYSGIGLFKLAILVFNLTPYLALRIVG